MKLKHVLSGILFLAAVVVIGCKGKPSKDMVVNKWKISDLSGNKTKDLPDSIKKQLMDKVTMEFTKDGNYSITGIDNDQKGTYTISDDLKTLTINHEGGVKAEVNDIDELSKSKLVLTDKQTSTKITLIPR